MTFERRTLRADVCLDGRGLHSGERVTVRILPGQQGIRFRHGSDLVQARPENVTDTRRSTRLGPIGTVEHLMSALAGLEITDAEVELDAPELPALDGSALPYVQAIEEVGIVSLGWTEVPDLYKRVFVQQERVKIAVAKGGGRWCCTYEREEMWPGPIRFETHHVIAAYAEDIAPARTFAHESEVGAILAAGLAKGLDADSVLLLGDRQYVGSPRYPDEPARHKMLDLMGDLYLSGVPSRFLDVQAERSGHASNVAAAHLVADAVRS